MASEERTAERAQGEEMRIELNQTKSGMTAEYELVHAGAVISRACQRNNLTFGGGVEFDSFPDHRPYTLCYQPAESLGNITKKKEDRKSVSYAVLDETGRRRGEIGQQYKKVSFLVSYEYVRLTFDGETCLMYLIGMGKEGMKYPIYDADDDRQIALIEKDTVVRGNLDRYRIAAVDERAAFLAYVCGLYLDTIFYAHRGEVPQKSVQPTYSRPTIRVLTARYDPAFLNETEE